VRTGSGSGSGSGPDSDGGRRDDGGRDAGTDAPDATDAGVARPDTFLIDFGLGFQSDHVEDYAMDLHVFAGSVEGTADEPDRAVAAFESGYAAEGGRAEAVLDRLAEVRDRGRYR
jgi:Kae1-associated kinase Bud32